MKRKETVFVIPTHRLRDVAQTIEKYDDNFRANGHALKIIIFDDSSKVKSRNGVKSSEILV
ncbi:hypothetical protein [Nostoc sp. UHCC 0252]|uniref:hypothetical protein n=1 Tax=Nostoc sp. UHCC 0252 TaxID=3110241 RepID=UPI002B1F1C84|nr:hypothetical protein [Nostoc sp. UHCC 0252]MEA5604924.1 hypothetical protein [Nostoc sp. UHCC 0252]